MRGIDRRRDYPKRGTPCWVCPARPLTGHLPRLACTLRWPPRRNLAVMVTDPRGTSSRGLFVQSRKAFAVAQCIALAPWIFAGTGERKTLEKARGPSQKGSKWHVRQFDDVNWLELQVFLDSLS